MYDKLLAKLEKVKKRGTSPEYTSICPFHKEKNPSFSLNLKREVYLCHGCGAKGTLKQLCSYLDTTYQGTKTFTKEPVLKESVKKTNINAFFRVLSSCLAKYQPSSSSYFSNKGLGNINIPNTFVITTPLAKISAGGFYLKEASAGDLLIATPKFIQHINSQGKKIMLFGSQLRNNSLSLVVNEEPEFVLCEGFATALTYNLIGYNSIACFNFHNLLNVAKNKGGLGFPIVSVDNDDEQKQKFLITNLKKFNHKNFITFKGEEKGFDANDFLVKYGKENLKDHIKNILTF